MAVTRKFYLSESIGSIWLLLSSQRTCSSEINNKNASFKCSVVISNNVMWFWTDEMNSMSCLHEGGKN